MLPQSLALSDSAVNNVSTRCNKLKAYAQKLWSSRTRLAYRANILQNVGCAFEGLLYHESPMQFMAPADQQVKEICVSLLFNLPSKAPCEMPAR